MRSRLSLVAVMFLVSACDVPNPNANNFMGGAVSGLGAWAEGAITVVNGSDHNYDTFVFGTTGLTDTRCAYVWSYSELPLSGAVPVKVTASNNATGCRAIGTYSCTFVPGAFDTSGTPHTLTIACTGQTTLNLYR